MCVLRCLETLGWQVISPNLSYDSYVLESRVRVALPFPSHMCKNANKNTSCKEEGRR